MANAQDTTGPRCLVVLNRASGTGTDDTESARIKERLATHGWRAELVELSPDSDIGAQVIAAVERAEPECVIAAGGDGTICAVAAALAGRGTDLGVLPRGTFNYFARRIGVPLELDEAIDAICTGESAPVSLGSVNGEIFINNASIGLYPLILRIRETVYDRWGRSRLAAYWSVLVAMVTVYRPLQMRITVDGTERSARAPMIFAAMSAYQLEQFGFKGAEAIRDGKFALLLAPDCGRFLLIWKALRIAFGGVRQGRDYTLLTGERVVVETRRAARLVALDGERCRMKAPFEFEILRDALRVRIPAERAAGAQSDTRPEAATA
ncbi:diacylglycerol/lipid kinase family protein [Poseidonocella sedimentorum]|uniref:Lipid kinase, YegS/Rv2252/BmrU family n=1 Tax=Poseidonocella sedimentorum TaxID=871652 RepID=A0A1I6D994_9RHOB|nr:diacylglycerol kinase family protein [Poseidonocella sedimentorum]SFR02040.1 lipid kinase, YegS/Rv2252/BmrU family [Poseidonocella sedimentorum]